MSKHGDLFVVSAVVIHVVSGPRLSRFLMGGWDDWWDEDPKIAIAFVPKSSWCLIAILYPKNQEKEKHGKTYLIASARSSVDSVDVSLKQLWDPKGWSDLVFGKFGSYWFVAVNRMLKNKTFAATNGKAPTLWTTVFGNMFRLLIRNLKNTHIFTRNFEPPAENFSPPGCSLEECTDDGVKTTMIWRYFVGNRWWYLANNMATVFPTGLYNI